MGLFRYLVRSSNLQDRLIAGKSLEPLLLPLHGNIAAAHQGNDLGYGKNAKDWTIRSQVLRVSLRSMDAVQRLYGGRFQ